MNIYKKMMGVMALFLLSTGINAQNCANKIDADDDDILLRDNCPYTTNPEQDDLNKNGTGEVCEQTTIVSPNSDLEILIKNAKPGDEFILKTGTYHLTKITNKQEIIIRGQGTSTILLAAPGEPFFIENSERIQIRNLTLALSTGKDLRQISSDFISLQHIVIVEQRE